MAMMMKVEKQSSKFITPSIPTPPTLHHYKLGFIDEVVGAVDVGVVLFYPANNNHSPNFVAGLEKSLEKTLTRLYPLADRYVKETQIIDCNDQGAEFLHAKVNIKLQDFLVFEGNVKFLDEFIPSKIGATHQQSDSLLATQVTTFECGGLAIGVSATHKIVDASTLCTFINEWACINREETESEFVGPGFNSSTLFPARGFTSFPVQPMSEDTLSKYTRQKFSFSNNMISYMKDKGNQRWSKVQLVGSIIWKAFMCVDLAIHNYRRESVLIQPVNLRGKMGSLIPKNSCGNLWGLCATESKDQETTVELADRLTDSVKKTITNFSMGQPDGEAMVLSSLSKLSSIQQSFNVIILTSWCKFPFYDADFGFGKPIWVAPGTIPANHSTYLMDDAEGNGVEAYVFLEVTDVPYFKEALEHIYVK